MGIVVWKNGDYMIVDGPTWEYENDSDWLVTIRDCNLHRGLTCLI